LWFVKGLEDNNPAESAKVSKAKDSKGSDDLDDNDTIDNSKKPDVDGSVVATAGAERGPQSTIHTNLSMLSLNVSLYVL